MSLRDEGGRSPEGCVDPAGETALFEVSRAVPRAAPLAHLLRLTDDTGVLEHAWYFVPDREHGYCTDDVARALLAIVGEPSPTPALLEVAGRYLSFLRHARLPDGRFHNRLSYGRAWLDEVGSDDSVGRAVWALGATAARAPAAWLGEPARILFEATVAPETPSPRANAFMVLGACELLEVEPASCAARAMLERCVPRLARPTRDQRWPWPEHRLAYDNGRIPEALIAAGHALEDRELVDDGISLLAWLVVTETAGARFSFTPAGGWAPGEPRPGFDQQPLEAAAMADACTRAWRVTGEQAWAREVHKAAAWFTGLNDVGVPLYDPSSGGCHDGLTADGVNRNQGAESTLAMISAFQRSRFVGDRS